MTDPFREQVSLSDPDPLWSQRYREAEAEIAERLQALSPTIEHIGSTAVPIRGKAIIDIQIAVEERCIDRVIAVLGHAGYCRHGQGGVPGREYLTRRLQGRPPVNVHLFAQGNTLLDDNRLIRDYLRCHPDAAQEYVAVKESALSKGHTDLLTYSHAKGPTVASLREAAHVASSGRAKS